MQCRPVAAPVAQTLRDAIPVKHELTAERCFVTYSDLRRTEYIKNMFPVF